MVNNHVGHYNSSCFQAVFEVKGLAFSFKVALIKIFSFSWDFGQLSLKTWSATEVHCGCAMVQSDTFISVAIKVKMRNESVSFLFSFQSQCRRISSLVLITGFLFCCFFFWFEIWYKNQKLRARHPALQRPPALLYKLHVLSLLLYLSGLDILFLLNKSHIFFYNSEHNLQPDNMYNS